MRDLLRRFPVLVMMFRRAYIDDRGWADALRGYDPGCKDLPEADAATAAQKAYCVIERKPPAETDSSEKWVAWRAELATASKSVDAAEAALATARKMYTRQVRATSNFERIGVRANICPIFWMTMIALITYFPFVVPIRGFGRFLYRRATPIRLAFAYSALALMLSFGAAYENEYPGTTLLISKTIGSGALALGEFVFVDVPVVIFYEFPKRVAQEVRTYRKARAEERAWAKAQRLERREEARRARAQAQRQARRDAEWDREHPAYARWSREQEEAVLRWRAEAERRERAWQRRQDAEESAANKQMLKDAALWIGVPAAIFALLLGFWNPILNFGLALFVYLVFILLGVRAGGLLERAVQACFRAITSMIRGLWLTITFPFRLGHALVMLAWAFAHAKYEQFCFRLDPPNPEVLGPSPQFYHRTEGSPATGLAS